MNKIILTLIIGIVFINGCSTTNFMGAKMYSSVQGFYVERWYLNPEYNKDEIPNGTKFYGASAQKIKHKFIIKYYISRPDGNNTIQIPTKDMWKVKHNCKDTRDQDDNRLFFYKKLKDSSYKKISMIPDKMLLPIKRCYEDGWCKLYPTYSYDELYVQKNILYQGKTIMCEKDRKRKIYYDKLDKIVAKKAINPWITPSFDTCNKYNGVVNKAKICKSNYKQAKKICKESGGKLPTIDELKKVIHNCRGEFNEKEKNKHNEVYSTCYRELGFTHNFDGYFSSSYRINKYTGMKTYDIQRAYFLSGTVGSRSKKTISSVLCKKD